MGDHSAFDPEGLVMSRWQSFVVCGWILAPIHITSGFEFILDAPVNDALYAYSFILNAFGE